MFIKHKTYTTENAVCYKQVQTLSPYDFRYFDKDGFELNQAEQKFYSAMNHPITEDVLLHNCWQVPWYTLPKNTAGLFLDHAMILQRCEYQGAARKQIAEFAKEHPPAQFLLQIKPKWGIDFDLNAIAPDGTAFEVLHIEVDTYDYKEHTEQRESFERVVEKTDWASVAQKIWEQKPVWSKLQSYDQNHWKAKHILGWEYAESLEKAII
jgi:hypothetical protein